MVLADFLRTHLLEPREQRLRAEGYAIGFAESYAIGFAAGYAQGRAEGRTEMAAKRQTYLERIRAGLLAMGVDPDEILSDLNADNDNARRC